MSHIDEGELTAYADGAYAADDPVAQQIAAHIAECANCRNRLAAASALTGRAGEVLAYAAPVEAEAPPFERIREAASTHPKRAAWMPAAWAASIIMALGLGWWSHTIVLPGEQKPVASVRDTIAPAPPQVAAAPQENVEVPTPTPSPRALAAPTRAAQQQPAEIAGAPATRVAAAPAEQAGAAQANASVAAAPPAPAVETHVIEGVAVATTRVSGDTLIVQQKLPDGTIVTLASTESAGVQPMAFRQEAAKRLDAGGVQAQRAVAAAPAAAAAEKKETVVVVVRGTRQITVSGPLPLDSLKALAGKIR